MSKSNLKSIVAKAIENTDPVKVPPPVKPEGKPIKPKPWNRFGYLKATTTNVMKHLPTEFYYCPANVRQPSQVKTVQLLQVRADRKVKELKSYRQVKLYLQELRKLHMMQENGYVMVFIAPAGSRNHTLDL